MKLLDPAGPCPGRTQRQRNRHAAALPRRIRRPRGTPAASGAILCRRPVRALTDPEHLREWAPFDSDRNLGVVGTAKLSTVVAPTPLVSETQVKRADAPKVLEFSWGEQDVRWELEPLGGGGTRLTLRHNIDRGLLSM